MPRDDRPRVEDSLCRSVLRWGNIPAALVCHEMSVPVTERMTFRMLRESTIVEFPATPFVSASPVGQVKGLLTNFGNSKLWEDWSRMCDETTEPARYRVLLASDVTSGGIAILDTARSLLRPHLVLPMPGVTLKLLALHDWLRELPWSSRRNHNNDEEEE